MLPRLACHGPNFEARPEAGDDIVNDSKNKDDIAGALTKVLWTASQLDDRSDFDDLLEAIQVLRPRWTGGGSVVAWRYLRRQAWLDALQVLENDDEDAKRSALHSALMALCLFGMQDPLWQSHARLAAEQDDHQEASAIGRRLLDRAAGLDDRVRPSNWAPATQGVVLAAANGVQVGALTEGFAASTSWVRA